MPFINRVWGNEQRLAAIKEEAEKLGFVFQRGDYLRSDENLIPKALIELELLGKGKERFVDWLITGKLEGQDFLLFDYSYTTRYSSGRFQNLNFHSQTVSSFQRKGNPFPRFTLLRQGMGHKIKRFFGHQDIIPEDRGHDFPFCLRGEDEASVKIFFGSAILDFLSRDQSWNIEAGDSWMILYHDANRSLAFDTRIKPMEIRNYLNSTYNIFKLFLS